MQKNVIIKYALIIFLLIPSVAFAETQKMKEHKVVKGDTLWDITEAELADPFRWPEVWKVNPWIKNPHWIYPKQIIKIPINLLKKEKLDELTAKPAAAAQPAQEEQEFVVTPPEQPAEVIKEPLQKTKYPFIDKNTLIASGYIADTLPGIGYIVDSPAGELHYGNDDLVYVSLDRPPKVGDKFYIIKASDEIEHPITGRDIGYVITISGTAEIVKIKDGETIAKITKCLAEINKNDRLVSYYEIETPLTTKDPHSPDVKGIIIAAGNNIHLQAMMDIIYLDKGSRDGIAAGDFFRTIAVGDHSVPNGVIQVISCREHTATAIIRSSTIPISPGNIFTKIDKD